MSSIFAAYSRWQSSRRPGIVFALLLVWWTAQPDRVAACRWALAASRSEPLRAEMIVTEPSHSLVSQALEAPIMPHVGEGKFYTAKEIFDTQWKHTDGWGIGAFDLDSLKPQRFRSGESVASEDSDNGLDPELLRVTRNTSSQVIMAHVRASSGGDPEESNSHPFIYGQLLWMHHGGCPDREALEDVLEDQCVSLERYADGVTDSEYIGALFARHLATDSQKADEGEHEALCNRTHFELAELREAMRKTVRDIQELSDKNDAPSSLNFAVSDGRHLIATRYRTSAEDPPTLYYTLGSAWDPTEERFHALAMPQDGTHTLRGDTLLMASEPLTKAKDPMETWRPLIKDQMLTYDLDSGELELYCLSERCQEDFAHRRALHGDCAVATSPLLTSSGAQ